MRRALALAAVSILAVSACSQEGAVTTTSTSAGRASGGAPQARPTSMPRKGGFGSSRLQFFEGCPALLDHLKKESLERVSEWGLGYNGYPWPMWRGGIMYGRVLAAESTAGGMATGDQASTAAPAATVPDFSGTNTQEVGVDEGDVVETNGTAVFVVDNDKVRVIDVETATVAAVLDVPQGQQQLLLDGNRLLVVTQPYSMAYDSIVSLFDVSEMRKPQLLERSHLEGRVVATRSIDGMARLVLDAPLANRLHFVTPNEFGFDVATAKAENERVIRESTIDDWMPRIFDEGAAGVFGPMSSALDCTNVAAPSEFAGLGVSWIASIDMRGAGLPVGTAGVVSNGETVYASTSDIYVATTSWDYYNPPQNQSRPAPAQPTPPPTLVHQFSLGADGSATYVASGQFEGRLLNQFSMSELDGDLRVAVTVDDYTGAGTTESFVRVLRPIGSELTEIGSVGGLGLTEQIQSVRFLGSQAYVVTFRQTDPLYVIDLSDPSAPKAVGELKIPGFSSYLHPVGDGLLLGVGQAATDSGSVLGTQLSLFDVSDPANPQQIATLPIGGHSDAEWDHRAFLYWPADGTIVLPTSPGWGNCATLAPCPASLITGSAGGVVVARLTDRTLSLVGVVQHEAKSANGCWNPLQRSIVIGDELATVGFDQVKFSDRTTLAARASVAWGTPDQYGCYYAG